MRRSSLPPRRHARTSAHLHVEPLEARTLLATFTVTGTGDSIAADGILTLREAITGANADASATAAAPHRIEFNIPGTGARTINAFRLPALTRPVIIDGYTQPGARANTLAIGGDAVLLVELSGGGGNGDGLTIQGGDSTIRGLVINRFDTGIVVTSDRNLIAGNFVGTDPAGVTDSGNVLIGVHIFSGAGNVVGGESAAVRNVVSGNDFSNIRVGNGPNFTPFPSGTIIQGNYVGTTASGTGRVDLRVPPQGGADGIYLASGDGTVIGGTTALARNVIAGNFNGISIQNYDTNLTIQGNYIGVDATGSVALGNLTVGIRGTGGGGQTSNNYTIGGATAGAGNVISGNGEEGISLSVRNLVIQGNFVGTNAAGTAAIGNGSTGVRVTAPRARPVRAASSAPLSDARSPCRSAWTARTSSRSHWTADDDGLALPWFGTIFMNPPNGRGLAAWIEKAREEVRSGDAKMVVALLPARPDTN